MNKELFEYLEEEVYKVFDEVNKGSFKFGGEVRIENVLGNDRIHIYCYYKGKTFGSGYELFDLTAKERIIVDKEFLNDTVSAFSISLSKYLDSN
jgi:hypothetical protein